MFFSCKPALVSALENHSNSLLTASLSNVRETHQSTLLQLQSSAQQSKEKGKEKEMKLGVLFLNLGGPETLQDVEGFLYNLFSDPDIIRLPRFASFLQKPIARFISKRRSRKSREAYRSIGGGSPIVAYTRKQSSLVEQELQERGLSNAKCYFAMRYWNPFTEEVLEQMQKDQVNTMVIVPLYPQYSISTSGSSLKLLKDLFDRQSELWGDEKLVHTVVPFWFHRRGYLKAMAKQIIDQIHQYTEEEAREGIHVLFSAHGVPRSYIRAGDPYQKQIEECVRLISQEVKRQLAANVTGLGKQLGGVRDSVFSIATRPPPSSSDHDHYNHEGKKGKVPAVQFHLSFQSRVGPVRWLEPYTEDKIKQLGREEKVKNLIVVPVSFVSEHIETLEEIDQEYRELAHQNGIVNWKRASALNTDPIFIEDLASLVIDALESPLVSIDEALSKNYLNIAFKTDLVASPNPHRFPVKAGKKSWMGKAMSGSAAHTERSCASKSDEASNPSGFRQFLSSLPIIGELFK